MKRRISSGRRLSVATLIAAAVFGGSFIPATANATTYYVAKTGSDSKSCTSARSTSTPKLTIKSGLSCLKAGDKLSIRKGVYAERIDTRSHPIPSGSSWDTPVTIAAYSGESVTLRPSSGDSVIKVNGDTGKKYLIFDGLIADGVNVTDGGFTINLDGDGRSGAGHIRFKNCEIKNSPRSGIVIQSGSKFNEIINCNIHDNGRHVIAYGLYITSSNNLIEKSKIHHNSGYGVHIYNGNGQRANNNIVRRNRAYNNSTDDPDHAGILIGSGDGNLAYNNIAYGQPVGIMVGHNSSTNSKVYNNTVYNNRVDGIQIRASSSTAIVKNNIAYSNGTNIHNYAGSKTIQSKNLTTNPSFTNASDGDFTLRSGSAAINAGTTLSQVSDDFKGISRPQGGDFDIGAYEYGTSQTSSSLSAPTNLQVVIQP